MGIQVRAFLSFPRRFVEVVFGYRPDRWDDLPDAAKSQPGLYSNIMSFSAGPRVSSGGPPIIAYISHPTIAQSCIGMRFSIIEIKIVIYILVTNFSFHDTGAEIIKANV